MPKFFDKNTLYFIKKKLATDVANFYNTKLKFGANFNIFFAQNIYAEKYI